VSHIGSSFIEDFYAGDRASYIGNFYIGDFSVPNWSIDDVFEDLFRTPPPVAEVGN
jgi:hypothetical protein